MNDKLDHQTIHDFQQGDEKALELIFKKYYVPLVYFATKIIGSQDESEDIVTEVFMGLFKRHNLFDNEANIRAFLYVSARNRCLNYLKAKKRHGITNLEFAEEIGDDTLLEYEYSIQAEIMDTIRTSIETLPEECRKVFKLLYFEEMKPAEVAARLKISVNTVYVQKSRAVNILRLKLAENPLVIACFVHAITLLQIDVFNSFY